MEGVSSEVRERVSIGGSVGGELEDGSGGGISGGDTVL